MVAEEFVGKLKEVCGERVRSVILYGSAAGGNFHKGHSDYNLMVVMDDVSLALLNRLAPLCQKWVKKGNPMPLFVSPSHLERSCDVFPIEFHDMKEEHRVLYGTDPLASLEIANTHLRLQCEGELKGKIIALRSEYLRLSPHLKKIEALILHSSSSFFALFRGLLRLLGEGVPPTKGEVLKRLNQRTQFDTSVFERILEVREGKRKLRKEEVPGLAEEYLTTLDKVSSFVDKL